MSGLQTVKLTLRGSPITLISIDTNLIKECERVLESHFSRKSPAFSEPDDAELPGTLGSFQMASALAIEVDGPPLPNDPCSQYFSHEIETNAAVFTDEIDKVKFSPIASEEFAPVITEVCSLNATHSDDWWPRRDAAWLDARRPTPRVKHEPRDPDVAHTSPDLYYERRDPDAAHTSPDLYYERRKKRLQPRWRQCKTELDSVKVKVKPRKKRVKGQAPGRLASALRSRDAPPVLLPFDVDVDSVDLETCDAPEGGRRNRPRDPLSVPAPAPLLPSPPRSKPFVSVLSVERFASVTTRAPRPEPRRCVPPGKNLKRKVAAKKMWHKRRLAAAAAKLAAEKSAVEKTAAEQTAAEQSSAELRRKTVSEERNGARKGKEKRRNGVVSTPPAAVPSDPVLVPVPSETTEVDSRSPAAGKGALRKCAKYQRAKFACNKCQAVFASKEERLKHRRTHRVPCRFCPARFLNQQYLELHTKIFHPESLPLGPAAGGASGRLAPDFAEDASKAIADSFDLRELCPNSDDSASDIERPRSPGYHPNRQVPKRRVHVCAACPMRCANAYLLRRHAHGHAAPDRIECAVCRRLFRNERTRAAHVEKTHGVEICARDEDAGPIPCKGCDALAVSPMRLAEHYCTAHINLALLGCGICHTVLSLTQWRTHASTHI